MDTDGNYECACDTGYTVRPNNRFLCQGESSETVGVEDCSKEFLTVFSIIHICQMNGCVCMCVCAYC